MDAASIARRPGLAIALGVTASVCLLLPAGASAAHAPAAALGLRSFEDISLGRRHAAEHDRQRAAARRLQRHWRGLSPSERRAVVRRSRRRRAAVVWAGLADPARWVGRWTEAPFALPNFAMNAVLLPTGKVAFWSWPPNDEAGHRPNFGAATLWDPSGAFEAITPPLVDPDGPSGPQGLVPAPIACSGQSLQADGSLLVAGGNMAYPSMPDDAFSGWAGATTVFTFDPWSETWTRQPDMAVGRWYPSQVELADGRTLILSGYTDQPPGSIVTDRVEMFDPAAPQAQRVSTVAGAERLTGLYPRLFLLPDHNVLLAGGNKYDSAILDTQSFTWQSLPSLSRHRAGGNAVLLPPDGNRGWTVEQIGGYDWDDGPGDIPASKTAESIEPLSPAPSWTSAPPLKVGRSYANTVLLPDGSMVAVGGGSGASDELGSFEVEPSNLRVELYNPVTRRWRLGPAQQEYRAYHSTALLLPDGRVWSAGDDFHPLGPEGAASTSDSAEIYSPPYLFRGGRPVVRRAPTEIRYGRPFGVGVGGEAERAVLMAPGAATHADDMSQRRIPLVANRMFGGLRVFAPDGPGIAPPGYYMLFVLNRANVPSRAHWVRLGPA